MLRKIIGRVANRIYYWYKVFRSFKPLTLLSAINLYISAIYDISTSLITSPRNPKTLLGGLYLVRPHKFIIFARRNTEDLYHALPGREGDVEKVISSLLHPGDIFIDVGANIGYYTLLASKKGAEPIAIEPIPTTASVLLANLKLNNIKAHVAVRCAYSKKTVLEMCIPQGGYFGLATLAENRNEKCHMQKVICDRLDSIVKTEKRIKLVKIDVEGAELEVLKGMEKLLEKTASMIIEISKDPTEMLKFLKSHGFKIIKLRFTTYILAYRCINC